MASLKQSCQHVETETAADTGEVEGCNFIFRLPRFISLRRRCSRWLLAGLVSTHRVATNVAFLFSVHYQA